MPPLCRLAAAPASASMAWLALMLRPPEPPLQPEGLDSMPGPAAASMAASWLLFVAALSMGRTAPAMPVTALAAAAAARTARGACSVMCMTRPSAMRVPCSCCSARTADAWSAKLTKPTPLQRPVAGSVCTRHDRMGPQGAKMRYSSSSVASGGRFLTYSEAEAGSTRGCRPMGSVEAPAAEPMAPGAPPVSSVLSGAISGMPCTCICTCCCTCCCCCCCWARYREAMAMACWRAWGVLVAMWMVCCRRPRGASWPMPSRAKAMVPAGALAMPAGLMEVRVGQPWLLSLEVSRAESMSPELKMLLWVDMMSAPEPTSKAIILCMWRRSPMFSISKEFRSSLGTWLGAPA
mmetsp:Transcript_18152/g.45771  ORF Transcript_18152/g.45771 Transcript_18152/m.45771 type:complete len:349 (+) Transcript_18152:2825-3871(+)